MRIELPGTATVRTLPESWKTRKRPGSVSASRAASSCASPSAVRVSASTRLKRPVGLNSEARVKLAPSQPGH